MPKRVNPKAQKRDWRWYASMLLNGLVALSMVLGTVLLFTGAPTPQATAPTIVLPTLSTDAGSSGTPGTPVIQAVASPTPIAPAITAAPQAIMSLTPPAATPTPTR